MTRQALLERVEYFDQIERAEQELITLPQVECPITNHFAPGVYAREIFMPAGTFIVGAKHLTEHLNVILKGRVRVMMHGHVQELQGPVTFVSTPGVQKVLLILEDTIWQTIHPTDETDLEKLEALLIEPSDARENYKLQMKWRAALES